MVAALAHDVFVTVGLSLARREKSAEATAMYDALHAKGAPVELHMFANQPHAFDSDPKLGRLCSELMLSFLDRYILKR